MYSSFGEKGFPGFGEEESGWLVEHLKKAVDLEASRGFIQKMRGKTGTHLMEICFNSRGRYMKITEFVAKRKPLVLVVPEGVKGYGWENLRKAIVSVQDLFVQVERALKEKLKKPQVSKGMYRGEWFYADVVVEKGPRNGAVMPVGKWARAVVCESKGKIRDWCDVGKAIARRESSVDSRARELNSEKRAKTHFAEVGKVTKVVRESLKLVDLTKVKLWVEMLPNVVLPALLEVEDGDWTYTVAVTVIGEDDGEDSLSPESNRSKDVLRSAGVASFRSHRSLRGYELLLGTMSAIAGGLIIAPILILQIQNRLRGERKGKVYVGPMAGSNVGPTKPDAFKARSDWAQFGEKDFGPLAGPTHEGSSNGGPERLRLQSSYAQGPLRKARSWPPRLEEASSTPKRNLEGGAHRRQIKTLFEANLFPPFSSFPLESSFAVQCGSFFISPVVDLSRRGGASCSEGVAFSLETSNRKFKDRPFLRETLSNPRNVVSQASLRPQAKPSTFPLEGFQVEGLTPRKMVKVQSVLESLRIRIVRIMEKVWKERTRVLSLWIRFKLEYKRIRFQEEKEDCEKVFKYSKPRCVMLQETKRVIWDRRRISEKMGDSRLTVNMRCFDEFIRESGLLDPPRRNGFYMVKHASDPICKRLDRFLFSLSGILFSLKVSRGLPRWTSDHSPICLETNPLKWGPTPFRFENMWLLHPEFKEKFRDWWQECTVEGWEGILGRLKGLIGPLFLESAVWLDRPFSEEEVRMAVFQLNKEKAPGPDGFTIAVYQECWDVIKEDLMRGVYAKFFMKQSLVSRSLCGRETILDAVLIANEVVDEKRRSCASKEGVQPEMEILDEGCLSSSSFAILVNGNAKGWVKASRGLRQGDPLSPFLFTLVADVLSRLMIRAEETGITEGFFVGRDRTRVSLLQFADDTIFFSKASWTSFKILRLSFWFLGKYLV
ncbi:putative mitochondrial protein [Vitis vinifera]|uniref:Putative mitochondrial protein n=1 Tax=Vitis vinifera TaxID=29760 RepID=A0A438GCP6_VITVI|nr:putative mitochondrial protein [Vitis vinifera]